MQCSAPFHHASTSVPFSFASNRRRAYNAVLPYTLSRTGSQLVLADGYLSPSRRAPAHLRAARRTPLLAVMSDPTYAFHGALALAQKRVVLANVRCAARAGRSPLL